MIISHRLKFAYFRVPRTASTTASLMLRLTGAFDENDLMTPVERLEFPGTIPGVHRHLTPEEAVAEGYITHEQLIEYNCVAGLREPSERYLSAYSHSEKTQHIPQVEVKRHQDLGLLSRPQHHYFEHLGVQVCEPMRFDDFDNEVRRVCLEVSGVTFPLIPKVNSSREPTGTLDDVFTDASARATVDAALASEIAFYNSLIS